MANIDHILINFTDRNVLQWYWCQEWWVQGSEST